MFVAWSFLWHNLWPIIPSSGISILVIFGGPDNCSSSRFGFWFGAWGERWEVLNACALITFLPFVSLQTSVTSPCRLFSELRHPPTWRQELRSMQNHSSVYSSPCVVYPFQGRVMRPPNRNQDLGASQGYFSMVALKKETFTFLFSSLSVILSEILHDFVTIPEPWPGIFKALSAASSGKMMDDWEQKEAQYAHEVENCTCG